MLESKELLGLPVRKDSFRAVVGDEEGLSLDRREAEVISLDLRRSCNPGRV